MNVNAPEYRMTRTELEVILSSLEASMAKLDEYDPVRCYMRAAWQKLFELRQALCA